MSTTVDPVGTPMAPTTAKVPDLTERERDVLELVTNGYSNAEISELLYVSINSVKTYIRSSYRKIGARTRPHAIIWGVRHGLLVDVEPAPPNGHFGATS